MTGAGELLLQTELEPRFVVDCRVNAVALVGQDRMIFPRPAVMVSCGELTGSEMLNTVPVPELPSANVVPYRVFPDKISPFGLPWSLPPVKS